MKYSILVPVYGGMPFIKAAVSSVLESRRSDFELIASVDGPDDGAYQWLKGIDDERLQVLQSGESLSMAEHWDLLAGLASGQWQMFLGQDDGLQEYGFELLDYLTSQAERRKIRAITGRRAFFEWSKAGSSEPSWISFQAKGCSRVRNLHSDSWLALLSVRSYHSLPQMYTSSLFSKDLIQEIRSLYQGQLICGHPQDANLAASCVILEHCYLRSEIPFSWVGSSSHSAGRSVSRTASQSTKASRSDYAARKKDYVQRVYSSPLRYPDWAGAFDLGDNAIYFWQALVSASDIAGRPDWGGLRKPLIVMAILSASFVRILPLSGHFFFRARGIRQIEKSHHLPLGLSAAIGAMIASVSFFVVKGRRAGRNLAGWIRLSLRAPAQSVGRNVVNFHRTPVTCLSDANALVKRVIEPKLKEISEESDC